MSRHALKVLYLEVGGSIHDQRVLAKLVDRGYDTYHVYLRPSGRDYSVPGAHQLCLNYDVSRTEPWVSGRAWRRLRAFLHFRRLLKQVQPDILHARHVQGPGLMAAASGFHPFVLWSIGSDILVHPGRSLFFRTATQFTLKRADAVICNSGQLKQKMIALGCPEKRIDVISLGVDVRRFRPEPERRQQVRQQLGWDSDYKVMVMTRWFKPIYGIEHFLRALPQVFRQVPQARAVLVGSGPLEPSLRQMAQDLGIQEQVHFAGAMPNTELPGYLNAADVYVSTSLSDGASVSLLEAMACSLPVVVTAIPSNMEWIEPGRGGYTVPTGDPGPLTNALCQVLRDGDRARHMGEVNRQMVEERADWDRNFSQMEEVYDRLLDQHRTGAGVRP